MRRSPLFLALAALIAFPPYASAVEEPNSGIDQYLESVPGAGDDRPGNKGGTGSGGRGSGGSGLSPEARNALEARGPIGAALADLADTTPLPATAPSGGGDGDAAAGDRSGQGQGDEAAPAVTAASEEGSGLANVLDALFGGLGGGMGIALPIILVGGVCAAALLFARRRRGSEPAPPA
jgi:hypothetical protein